MMFFHSPEMCRTTLEREIRKQNVYELPDTLSDLCGDYWETYCNVHAEVGAHDIEEREAKIQSYFMMQALVTVLKEWGWWDKKHNIPYDWTKEYKNGANTERVESTDGEQDPY
jgi:hypothetical protein